MFFVGLTIFLQNINHIQIECEEYLQNIVNPGKHSYGSE
jgi:hypothetical protein